MIIERPITGYTEVKSFSYSKRLYSFDLSTFKVLREDSATVEAVWIGRSNGRNTLSFGIVHCWVLAAPQEVSSERSIEEWLKFADARYGGDCLFKWDGDTMWSSKKTSLEELSKMIEKLNPIFVSLPDKPSGETWSHWMTKS